jgi:hypothetical protein
MEYLTGAGGLKFKDVNGDGMTFAGPSSDYMRILTGGAVGIGTSQPAGSGLHVYNSSAGEQFISSSNSAMRFVSTGGANYIQSGTATSSSSAADLIFTNVGGSGETMRIDSSGNVKVKTGDLQIGESQANSGSGRYVDIYNQGTDSTTFAIMRLIRQQAASTSLTTSEFYARKNGETTLWNFETSSSAYLRAGIGTTEGWRIHSSGNVLLGKSSPAFGTAGVELNNAGVAGKVHITRSGGEPLALNRLSSDGTLLEFYRGASSFVGAIAAVGGDLRIGGLDDNHAGLRFAASEKAMLPVLNSDGSLDDGNTDLGASNARFDDVNATNGTIQTSDRNEKQDIEELTEAEQRVAVACKGLLRKFRWKSAVEEKGDDARIHFGIIAQDLQDAFTAEGLDAGRYGMFINSTWTDEETGEERSRMGVRYSELLAFIISAI